MLSQNGFTIIPITRLQLESIINDLPFYHRDPFDRLIIAAAKAENMIILTADENIQKYNISYLW